MAYQDSVPATQTSIQGRGIRVTVAVRSFGVNSLRLMRVQTLSAVGAGILCIGRFQNAAFFVDRALKDLEVFTDVILHPAPTWARILTP